MFSCYRPVSEYAIPAGQRVLSAEDWISLLVLAHTDKSRAFEAYAGHYLATSGQLYWSDDHQLATYLDGYHTALDRVLEPTQPGHRDDHRAGRAASAVRALPRRAGR